MERPEVAETITDPNTSRCYRRDELLGQGTSGKCFKVTDLVNGETFAVKVIPLGSSILDMVYEEVKILKKLQHKNIVGFSHSFEDQHYMYIFMELCSRQTLRDILNARGTLTYPEVRYYMRQLISGLKYIHRKGYVHRDIKLDNLFINDEMQLKIGDFGLATKLKPRKKNICGTQGYMAPEVWNQGGNGVEAEVWALGCVMHQLLVGDFPCDEELFCDMVNNIKGAKYTPSKSLSVEAGKLFSKIFQMNPRDRPTLRKILCHKFFTVGYTPKQLPLSSCDAVPQFEEVETPPVTFFRRLAQCVFRRMKSRVEPSFQNKMHSSIQVVQPAESPILVEVDSRPLTMLTWSSWSEWLRDIQTGCTNCVH